MKSKPTTLVHHLSFADPLRAFTCPFSPVLPVTRLVEVQRPKGEQTRGSSQCATSSRGPSAAASRHWRQSETESQSGPGPPGVARAECPRRPETVPGRMTTVAWAQAVSAPPVAPPAGARAAACRRPVHPQLRAGVPAAPLRRTAAKSANRVLDAVGITCGRCAPRGHDATAERCAGPRRRTGQAACPRDNQPPECRTAPMRRSASRDAPCTAAPWTAQSRAGREHRPGAPLQLRGSCCVRVHARRAASTAGTTDHGEARRPASHLL